MDDLQTTLEEALHQAVSRMTQNELQRWLAWEEREKLERLIARLQSALEAVIETRSR